MIDLLIDRRIRGRQTVLYIRSLDDAYAALGGNFVRLIKESYTLVNID